MFHFFNSNNTVDLKENLSKNLPLFRGGNEEAGISLDQMLNDHDTSAFNYIKAHEFLKYRTTEMNTVELAMNEDGIPGIFIDDGTDAANRCKWKKSHVVIFELNVLPSKNIVQSYLDTANHTDLWTEPSDWYDNDQDYLFASTIYKNFENYRKVKNEDIVNKKQDEDVCFLITLKPLNGIEEYRSNLMFQNQYAKVVILDEGGEVLKNNFTLVGLDTPRIFNDTSTSIEFEVALKIGMIDDGFTNKIDVEIKQLDDDSNGPKETLIYLQMEKHISLLIN